MTCSIPGRKLQLDKLSWPQQKVLVRALHRGEPYVVCPTPGLWSAVQTTVLGALRHKGLITEDGAPVLTKAGVEVALHCEEGHEHTPVV